MKRIVGMGTPNGAATLSDLLVMGFQSYLCIHPAYEQVAAIREAQPDALIYIRRYGGIGGSPQDVAYEMSSLYDQYSPWGVEDLIGWNEPDRAEEGGFNVAYIRDFALAYLVILRKICPRARVHWPALAHLERYQGDEPDIWVPTARLFDVIDFHAYHHPNNVRAYFQWISTFLPGRPIACTEYNWGPGNARPDDYGAWLYEVYRMAAQDFPSAEAVMPFIWSWENPEPGVGTSLDIKSDPSALAGIRRAIADFRAAPVPQPAPEEPMPETIPARPAQKPYQRNWFDDGNDCLSSSFAEALRLTYSGWTPDVPEMEAAYRQWHPDWDDNASTMRLDWYWEALNSIGVYVEALHERGDIVDQIGVELAQDRYPTVWLYLWDAATAAWFHHAVVGVAYAAGQIAVWDQQRGFSWNIPLATFLTPGMDSCSSGYGYSATYTPLEQAPEPEAPVDDLSRVSEEKAGILSLMDHQWGFTERIRGKGYADLADQLQRGLVAVKNLLGEP